MRPRKIRSYKPYLFAIPVVAVTIGLWYVAAYFFDSIMAQVPAWAQPPTFAVLMAVLAAQLLWAIKKLLKYGIL